MHGRNHGALYQFQAEADSDRGMANETISILNHLHALVPDEHMYELMKAQAFIINRQRQEAKWILDDFQAQ